MLTSTRDPVRHTPWKHLCLFFLLHLTLSPHQIQAQTPALLVVRLSQHCTATPRPCLKTLSSHHNLPSFQPLLPPPNTNLSPKQQTLRSKLARTWTQKIDAKTLTKQQLHTLRSSSLIEAAWIDRGGFAGGAPTPADPYFSQQQYLEQSSDADIDAASGWLLTKGSKEVLIALLDTGIDATHPDLAGALLPGKNFTDTPEDHDTFGHGTHIAGLLAARENDTGIIGVCPRCSLLPLKVLDHEGKGFYAWWAAGIVWAVDEGADIINLSLGGAEDDPNLREAIAYANASGVTLIASMMNNANQIPQYPAKYSEVIAVSATDHYDAFALEWGPGLGSNWGSHVGLTAPGVELLGPDLDRGYSRWSGTSQAAALVSGTAGLLLSAAPNLSPKEVEKLLFAGAEDRVGLPQEDLPGFDPFHGHGRLNAFNSLIASNVFPDQDQDGIPDKADAAPTDPLIGLDAENTSQTTDIETPKEDVGAPSPSPKDCQGCQSLHNPQSNPQNNPSPLLWLLILCSVRQMKRSRKTPN